jgi:DNA-binding NtrC family response regulator
VLVADDQRDVLEALRLLLRPEGFELEAVGTPASVVDAVSHRDFDVALVDLNYTRDTTSGEEGLELLRELRRIDATLPVVVMTAWGSIELAVEAMRHGARDFVQKPWENERLLSILRNQVELGRAVRARERLEAAQRPGDAGVRLVAESAAMRPVVELVARVAPSEAVVLVTGENGTGKGVVARALHAASPRAARPLVTVNLGGLAPGTFESELFGHVRGAFTDAKADRVGRFEAPPTARPSSSTRSATFRSTSRRSSCACSRRASSSGSAPRARSASTPASWRRPTPTSPPRSRRAASGATSSSG